MQGGIQNTGGGLQQQGIPIPHPPVISPNPTTGATINDNELVHFLPAGNASSADVTAVRDRRSMVIEAKQRRVGPLCQLMVRQQTWHELINSVALAGL